MKVRYTYGYKALVGNKKGRSLAVKNLLQNPFSEDKRDTQLKQVYLHCGC